ncbi:MAG TPA: type II toxin-antitoxin system HipA family toxin [Flavipsychrobacter sp.]|nr:type II toxin-antitoxin system HipA family toxin [Flavipsychrobacter sp.]
MSKNNLITVACFGQEIGRLGFDPDRGASFFQYNADFLAQEKYVRLFPLVFRRIRQTQVFDKYNNETFRGLPPMIADSLPDLFGNIIFRTWIESNNRDVQDISVLEQLAYVGSRGMGALEYRPATSIATGDTIDINEIAHVVGQVLDQKQHINAPQLDHTSLLNIFKIGTSAGGMRPKILVAEHKATGNIIPGDIVYSDDYHHYLIKLGLDEQRSYSRELIEYVYYLAATHAGIQMMPSKMINKRHFATLRFDRQNGQKKHILTATGLTGWDYTDPKVSSYEQLFDLALFLKCPHKDVDQLFRRMVFNLVFANHDDHLKNHSFIYDEVRDSWGLAPAYDLTYSLNPELNIKTTSRALSINGKRTGIDMNDLSAIAEKYTIKHFKGTISAIEEAVDFWIQTAKEHDVPAGVIAAIQKHFSSFS